MLNAVAGTSDFVHSWVVSAYTVILLWHMRSFPQYSRKCKLIQIYFHWYIELGQIIIIFHYHIYLNPYASLYGEKSVCNFVTEGFNEL